MGDFSHGPIVLLEGKPCQTHLSAWIDSHSRYIVDTRYYLRENLDILVDSLLRAWAKHGSPRELYADNGKVYHANGLTVACAKLNIRKLHRPPREPEPGGLIERFFQTVQSQFSSEVDASKTLTFKELNQAFEAWLQAAYHQQVNRITGQRPHDRYFTEYRLVRTVPITEVESYFYQSQLGQMFSHHLGRSGIASFTTEELGALQTFHEKYPQVRSWQVLRAFEQAAGSGLAQTLWQLQSLPEDLGSPWWTCDCWSLRRSKSRRR